MDDRKWILESNFKDIDMLPLAPSLIIQMSSDKYGPKKLQWVKEHFFNKSFNMFNSSVINSWMESLQEDVAWVAETSSLGTCLSTLHPCKSYLWEV